MSEWGEIYAGDDEALRRFDDNPDRVRAIRNDPGLREMVQRVAAQCLQVNGFDLLDRSLQPYFEVACDAGIALYLTGLAHGEIYEARIRSESDNLTEEVTEAVAGEGG